MTHGPPVAWAAARSLAAGCVPPLEPSVVPLESALGHAVADDVQALTDLPAVDAAAMDGWAVAGPPPWRETAGAPAGWAAPGGVLRAGEAVAIATGAPLPPGAQAVLRRERGRLEAGVLDGDPPAPGTDVRLAGRECLRGDVILPAGSLVGPVALGMLAAAGLDRVAVRRVSADLLVLGDELLRSGPARDGLVRDALGPLLSAWLPAWGVTVASRRHVPDTAAALRLALTGCRGDVVITTGSTARGPVDHLHAVLAELAARWVVDGVAVRPGRPQLLAVLPDGRPLVGLPGNPLAAVCGLFTLLAPVLDGLRVRPSPTPRTGLLAVDVPADADATRLVPVRDGVPVPHAGSGMLRGLAAAQAVAVIPPGGARAGQGVELLAIP